MNWGRMLVVELTWGLVKMEIVFRNWVFSCVSIGTSSSNEVFTKFEGGFVNKDCWVSMLYRKKGKIGEKMWRNTIRWGPDLSIRKTTNVVSLVLKGIWSSVSCYLWIQGLNFKRLRGENYYCCLIDTYLVNKIIHKFSKAAFERLDLKERIFS